MQMQELSRPLAHDEEEKLQIFMDVRKVSRETALKFLFGRKFEVERAHILLNNYQKLVLEHHFEMVTVSDVIEELRTGLMYIPGTRDRNGAALFVIDAGKYQPGKFTPNQLLRLAFYMGNRVIESPKTQSTGVTIIVDMSEFEWSKFELGMQRRILDMFTNNIPARVKNILLYRAPWWISTLVKLVSPFLKEKMRQRIQVCSQGTLQRYCEVSQLPQSLDGEHAFNLDEMIEGEIERQGRDSFRKERRLDAFGKEITQAAVIPAGSVIMVSPQTEALLQEERTQLLKALDARLDSLKHEVKDMKEDMGTGPKRNINALLAKRASRMSIDWVAMQQAQQATSTQPNAKERARGEAITEEEEEEAEEDTKEAIKAKLKDRIDRNRVPSPTSTMTTSSPKQSQLTTTSSPRQPSTTPVKSPSPPPLDISEGIIERLRPSPAAEEAKQVNVALEEQKDIFKAELEARIARRVQEAKEEAVEKAKQEYQTQQESKATVPKVVVDEVKEPSKPESDKKEEKPKIKVEETPKVAEELPALTTAPSTIVIKPEEPSEEAEEIKKRVIRRRNKDVPSRNVLTKDVSSKETSSKEDSILSITSITSVVTKASTSTKPSSKEEIDDFTNKFLEEEGEKKEAADEVNASTLSSSGRPIRRRRSSSSRSAIEPHSIDRTGSPASIVEIPPPDSNSSRIVSEYDLMSALKVIKPPPPRRTAETIDEEAADVIVPPAGIRLSGGGANGDVETRDVLRGSRRRNTTRKSNRSFVLTPDSLNLKQ